MVEGDIVKLIYYIITVSLLCHFQFMKNKTKIVKTLTRRLQNSLLVANRLKNNLYCTLEFKRRK